MPAGRPTKLTRGLIDKAKAYDYEKEGDVVPTVEGLALFLNIARSTVYAWATPVDTDDEREVDPEVKKLHEQFSDILAELLAKQSRLLINKGLKGSFNSTITKMLLSAKHGYVEKQATDLTSNGKDLPVPILGSVSVRSDDSN